MVKIENQSVPVCKGNFFNTITVHINILIIYLDGLPFSQNGY
jgi:hypothetical protein